MTSEMILDKLAQMLRVGFVTARQPEKMRLQVELRDTVTQALVTDWLPMLCLRACGDMDYDLPDVGDQVLCAFLPFGHEQGFVLGAMYGKQTPPVQSGDKWHRKFKDGTTLEYDRETHKLTGNVQGDVEITAKGQINLDAPAMNLGAPGGGATAGTVRGNLNQTQGDHTVEGISFLKHTHTCPACGAQTSPPTGGGGGSTGGGSGSGGNSSGDSSGDANGGNDAANGSESGDVQPGGDGSGSESGQPESGGNVTGGAAMTEAEIDAALATLAEKVEREGDDVDALILCLPKIVETMEQKQEAAADRKGWNYLRQMFRRWLSGSKNDKALSGGEPFWIDWDWAMEFPDVASMYSWFTDPDPWGSGNILNDAAKQSLGKYLCQHGFLIKNENKTFEFITPASQWRSWNDEYHTSFTSSDCPPGTDGISAALGGFALRALANGRTEWISGDKYVIHVDKIAVVIWDSFNFQEETGFFQWIMMALAGLGWWSCADKNFAPYPATGHTQLKNEDFRKFRENHKRGSDFMVLTPPHEVENFQGASYVFTCAK